MKSGSSENGTRLRGETLRTWVILGRVRWSERIQTAGTISGCARIADGCAPATWSGGRRLGSAHRRTPSRGGRPPARRSDQGRRTCHGPAAALVHDHNPAPEERLGRHHESLPPARDSLRAPRPECERERPESPGNEGEGKNVQLISGDLRAFRGEARPRSPRARTHPRVRSRRRTARAAR